MSNPVPLIKNGPDMSPIPPADVNVKVRVMFALASANGVMFARLAGIDETGFAVGATTLISRNDQSDPLSGFEVYPGIVAPGPIPGCDAP